MTLEERITFNAEQCGGRACIRGMRIRVADILEMLAQGVSEQTILADFPDLEAADIRACMHFGAQRSDMSNKKERSWSGFISIVLMVLALYVFLAYLMYEYSQKAFVDYGAYTPSEDKSCPVDYVVREESDPNGVKRNVCVSTFKQKFEGLAKFGPIGDSFGIINSILSTLTLAILAATLIQQREQLDEQRQRFEAERKESDNERAVLRKQHNAIIASSVRQVHDRRVFDWLDLHHRMIERIDLLLGNNGVYGQRKGSQAVNRLCDVILFETWHQLRAGMDPTVNQREGVDPTISPHISTELSKFATDQKKRFHTEVERLFVIHRNRHDGELGHIFRNAYRLLKWIDCEPDISAAAKWEYVSTFRAQLSFGELSLMLLNCAAEDSRQATPLFSRYAMFENLPKNDPLVICYSDNNQFSPSAFDGRLAKPAFGLQSDWKKYNT
jgi:uncharacterized protein (DUF433 family)